MIGLTGSCFSAACVSQADTTDHLAVVRISGLPKLLDLMLTYQAPAAITLRMPVLPEVLPPASRVDLYYGNDQPRIAPLWGDLNPAPAGSVVVSQTAGSWTVSFEGVPQFGSTIGNTFAVTLTATGGIEFSYGATAGNDGLVGITPGCAANPGETDLSAAGAPPAAGTTYELFGNGEFEHDNVLLTFVP